MQSRKFTIQETYSSRKFCFHILLVEDKFMGPDGMHPWALRENSRNNFKAIVHNLWSIRETWRSTRRLAKSKCHCYLQEGQEGGPRAGQPDFDLDRGVVAARPESLKTSKPWGAFSIAWLVGSLVLPTW